MAGAVTEAALRLAAFAPAASTNGAKCDEKGYFSYNTVANRMIMSAGDGKDEKRHTKPSDKRTDEGGSEFGQLLYH